jgi:phage shock protein PspC (stress-responsive transcriptional regulator)
MIGPVRRSLADRDWFYARDGQVFGPTDRQGLAEMAAARHLTQSCEVWRGSAGRRVLAGAVEGLGFPPAGPPPLSKRQEDPRYSGLYRSSDQRMLLGVCAGLAHKLGVPVIGVRIVFFLSLYVLVGWAYFLGLALPALPTKYAPSP